MSITIVVADRGGARFFTTDNLKVTPRLACRIENPSAHLRESDLGSDSPGRVMNRSGVRHSLSPRSGPRDVATRRFARAICQRLARGPDVNVGQIVLIAQPRFMALLTTGMPRGLAARIRGKVPKDLIHATATEIRDCLVTGSYRLVAGFDSA